MVSPPPPRTVSGQVFQSDGQSLRGSGFTARAFDAISATNLVPLGSAVALQANGTYRIPYTWQSTGGRNGPNLLVQVFNPQGMIVGQATRQFANPQTSLNITVNLPAPPPPTFNLFCVTLNSATNAPIPNLRVEASFQVGDQLLFTESDTTSDRGELPLVVERSRFNTLPTGQPIAVTFRVFDGSTELQTPTTLANLQLDDQKVDIAVVRPMVEERYTVRGTVSQSNGQPLAGAIVHVVDWDRNSEDQLFTTRTNANGYYEGQFTDEQFRSSASEVGGPDLIVRVYNEQGQLLARSPRRNNSQQEETIDLTVTVLETDLEANALIVQGTVTLADRILLPNILVRAFDRDMRSEELLGATRTDAQGFYQIRYFAHQFQRAEKGSADLVVRVYGQTDATASVNQVELAASDILFNAPPVATLDVTVPAVAYRGPSEWEQHHATILPLRVEGDGVTLVEPAAFTDEDLDFLAPETGIAIEHLRHLRQDAQWSEAHDVPEAVFYGLLRQGLPTELRSLLAEPPSRLREALEAALAENQIPQTLTDDLDGILERLHELAVDIAFQTDSEATIPSLGEILGTAPLDTAAQRAFIDFALRYEGQGDIWNDLAEQSILPPAALETVRFTVESSPLVLDHLPTLAVAQRLRQAQNWHTPRDLARLTREQWQSELDGIPTGDLPGDISSTQQLADAVVSQIEQAYPTAVVMHRLASGSSLATNDAVAFLVDNPNFNLLETSIDRYLANGAQLGQITDIPSTSQHLKLLQRLARVTPTVNRFEAMQGLWENGYTSAVKIANTNQMEFIEQMNSVIGLGNAEAIHNTAIARADEAQITLLRLGDAVWNGPDLGFGSGSGINLGLPDWVRDRLPDLNLTPSNPSSELPDWTRLFGSLSGCSCRHCRSAYSPAAYLVDLLQFLRKAPSVGRRLRTELERRRPDIEHLLLNCDNANTPLPYIDLVNEILERQVSGLANERPFLQTEGSTPEDKARLRAMPAYEEPYEEPLAYRRLASARYPWILPFDLHRETISLWTQQLGLDLSAVRSLFNQQPEDIARTYLQLSPSLWARIVQQIDNPGTIASLWGYTPTTGNPLSNWRSAIPEVLKRTGLNYEALEAVVQSQYMQDQDISIDKNADPCRIERHHLTPRPQPSVAALDRLHRFIRLQRALGWSVTQLDEVLAAYRRLELDADTLLLLADTQKLAHRLRISVEEAALLVAQPNALAPTLATLLRIPERDIRLFLELTTAIPDSPNPTERVNTVLDGWDSLVRSNFDLYELAYCLHHQDLTPPVFEPLATAINRNLLSLFQTIQTTRDRFTESNNTSRIEQAIQQALAALPASATAEVRNTAIEAARQDTLNELGEERDREIEAAIVEQLAQWIGSSGEVIRLLLLSTEEAPSLLLTTAGEPAIERWMTLFPAATPEGEWPTPDDREPWLRLDKALRLIQGLDLTPPEIAALSGISSARTLFNSLPISPAEPPATYENWETLARAKQFNRNLPSQEHHLFQLLQQAEAPAASRRDMLARLSVASGWDIHPVSGEPAPILEPLTDALWPGDDVAPFQQVETYERLHQAVQWIRRYRIEAETLIRWGTTPLEIAATEESREAIQALIASLSEASRGRYANLSAWYQAITPAMDRLRERKRDALVAYLLANPLYLDGEVLVPAWRTTADLYVYFLIDVEMSACQLSSRIVQATNAIQLFVQRLRMSLESDELRLSETHATYWQQYEEWMKNYRVWEANRKVLLYPENWIEPDLRDNKSPFFKELESDLLQDEINPQTVEQAYRNYFTKLSDVAHLDIRGLYDEVLPNNGGKVLHVFGRTYKEPYVYYYRKRLPNRVWTAWELVEAGIAGNYLIPVVRNGQLMLFWAMVTEEESSDQVEGDKRRFWNIEINWSMYRDGSWTEAGTEHSPHSLSIEGEVNFRLAELLTFRLLGENETQDELEIGVFYGFNSRANQYITGYWGDRHPISDFYGELSLLIARFTFKGCNQQLHLQDELDFIEFVSNHTFITSQQSRMNEMGYRWSGNSFGFQQREWFSSEMPEHLKDQALHSLYSRIFDVRMLQSLRIEYGAYHSNSLLNAKSRYPLEYFLLGNPYLTYDATFIAPPGNLAFNPLQPFVFENRDEGRQYFVSHIFELVRREPAPEVPGVNDEIQFISGGSQPPNALIGAWINENHQNQIANAIAAGNFYGSSILNERALESLQYQTVLRFHFEQFYHPYFCNLVEEFNRHGIEGILKSKDVRLQRQIFREPKLACDALGPLASSVTRFHCYQPKELVWKNVEDPYSPYPYEQFEFSEDGAYSLYNWELFFHIPLLVADRLSKNQRFEEAQQWFHYIFDPTDFSSHPTPAKYWQVKPLYELAAQWSPESPAETLEDMLRRLSTGNAEYRRQIAAWRKDPFNPHRLARMRPITYMKTVVQKYLDNLIAWGDQLFRQDTMESINEAIQLYILASQILGPRPVTVEREDWQAFTYRDLLARWDDFSNALVPIENLLSGDSSTLPTQRPNERTALSPSLALYFCIPFNEKLKGYWDTVEDRLFKVRNCMNLEGQVRQLALFAPPIDPALLVRARAMGLNLGDVLSNLGALGLPHYRYQYLVQKALEFCGEVKNLGAALLAALEKKDAEGLALMRSRHEMSMLKRVTALKDLQITENDEMIRGLQASRRVIEAKLGFYASRQRLNFRENDQILSLESAKKAEKKAKHWSNAAKIKALIPEFKKGAPTTAGSSFGGKQLTQFAKLLSTMWSYEAADSAFRANKSGINAQFDRRQDDWNFQAGLAARELAQIDRQILAAEIRRDIAIKDKANHLEQIRQAEEVDRFMRSKFTNAQLYSWMAAQLSALHYHSYKLAFDMVQRAERAARFELGLEASDFGYIQFGHWDSQKKGLLSGDRLMQDLRRLESAYLDRNRREHELTKHISLVQLNPIALLALKETGQCEVELPEVLFDLDHPGHYMRRLKTVSLTIPCVAGPYTSINCKLTLLSSKIRTRENPHAPYPEDLEADSGDDRFSHGFAATQSIATSSAQNDSGLFELNFRDERYLPFEGAGVISTWRLELSGKWPANPPGRPASVELPQFDFDTISDVILHLRYTARDGGERLKQAAVENLEDGLNALETASHDTRLFRLFSLRHEFPTEWHQFKQSTEANPNITISFSQDRFPFFVQGKTIIITQVIEHIPGEPNRSHSVEPSSGPEWTFTIRPSGVDITPLVDLFVICHYTIR